MGNVVKTTDDIFTIPGLATDRECDDWIARSESLGYEEATISTERGQRKIPEIRNNARVIVDDAGLADDLWSRIASQVPFAIKGWEAIGLNPRFRFYRYDVAQKFSWHADGCIRLDNGQMSQLTFMIYLNDDFTGGETLFRHGIKVEPQKGMALLFTHWQKHMGNEVSAGRKYVLRSDVMYRHGA